MPPRRPMSSPRVDEPIADLSNTQPGVSNKLLLVVLGRVRVFQMCHKPPFQVVGDVLRQITPAFSAGPDAILSVRHSR